MTLPEVTCVPDVIVRVAVALPMVVTLTLVGLIDQVGHWGLGHAGRGVVDSATVPVNPLMLPKWIVDVPVAPGASVRVVGKAWIVKLPVPPDEVIVKVTFVECDRDPDDPMTVTVYVAAVAIGV